MMTTPQPSYLVLDIETVPDPDMWPPAEIEPSTDEKKKDLIAPPHSQRPVAIGCLWLDREFFVKRIGCIGASKHGDNERAILTDWNEFMAKEKPAVVTWNGRSFDMPVLTLRSFKWGIPQRWYDKDYRYRYNDERHLDLMDVMNDYGSAGRGGFKLDIIAKMIGLPGKYGVNGSQVARMYAEGQIAEIERYCLTDIVQTAFVLHRFMLIRGRINIENYRKAVNNLLETVKADKKFQEFSDLIKEKNLLLE